MNEKERARISKFLSLVLRHQPGAIGLTLDEGGWASVKELLEKMEQKQTSIDHGILKEVVATNNKKRFAFNEDGTKIRASQGHSIEVKLGYNPSTPPSTLYHGTAQKNISAILKEGLVKRNRQYVHLSADKETAINVGLRHGKPVVLEVRAGKMHSDGYPFFVSANQVWLTDHVPSGYLHCPILPGDGI